MFTGLIGTATAFLVPGLLVQPAGGAGAPIAVILLGGL